MKKPENYSSNIIKDFLSEMSWWDRFTIDLKIRKDLFLYNLFPTFYLWRDLFWLRLYGFKPIYIIRSFFCETTFIFKTEREAARAFALLERRQKRVIGWWYGVEDFRKTLYEEDRSWGELETWYKNID